MDLFVDKYFKKDVENKFDYHQLFHGSSDPAPSGVTFTGTTPNVTRIVFHNKTILVCDPSNIDSIKALENNVYLQEYKVSSTCKKYIVE